MRSLPQSNRPKISTMPRPRTEATRHLELYKLAIEKARLINELASLDNRRVQIEARLEAVQREAAQQDNLAISAAVSPPTQNQSRYKTFVLEY